MTRERFLLRRMIAAVLLVLSGGTAAFAQLGGEFGELPGFGGGVLGGGGEEEVSIAAEFTPAAEGKPAILFVTATIAPGMHIYAIDQGRAADGGGPNATSVSVGKGQPVKLLAPFRSLQKPMSHVDKVAWVGLELREHYEQVTWYAPIELTEEVDPQSFTIAGSVFTQACTESSCSPPADLAFTAAVGPGMELPAAALDTTSDAVAGEAAAGGSTADAPMAGSSLLTVAAYGLLGGLILNLMPCVLPVIGLKLFSFAKQGGQSRAHILGLNISYTAGLLSVFMVLATLAAAVQLGIGSTSFGWGQIYTFTWFKVTMTALVFVMALSFLGVWEIPIPGFATSGKATALASQEGMFGAFCMGIITTLLAVPCSGPFLGPVFGYTISQPPFVTYVVFASVGLGMASPYLLIGMFPSLIGWLPKPGAWMDTLKNLMGFGLLATVVYLFTTINSDFHTATLSLLVGLGFTCWIVGRVPAYDEGAKKFRAWATGLAVAALVGVGSFKLLTPSDSPLAWQPYSPQALQLARAQGKTVLVEFTADWCLTCQANKKWVIETEEVKRLVEQNEVVPLLADWSDRSKSIENALAELNSRSIPLLAIYPADPSREVIVLPDLLTQATVLEALETAGPSLDKSAMNVSAEVPENDAPAAPTFGAAIPAGLKR